MNSEKVKEIKKALELNEYYAIEYFPKSGEPKIFTFTDLLTLINELESENERLNKALVDNLEAYKDGFNEGAGLKGRIENRWKKENQQLKDRIAELEKGNQALSFAVKQGFNDCQTKTLKQFAERLKEKCKSTYDFFQCPTKENRVISISDIDEALKEFIDANK